MSNKQMDASERHVGGMVASELGGSSIKGYTEEDRKDMWRMGKKQELRHVSVLIYCATMTDRVHFRRNFRFISTVGYATCVYGTWEIYLT
jgi:choline transport protein